MKSHSLGHFRLEPCEQRLLFDDSPHVGDLVADRTFGNDKGTAIILPGNADTPPAFFVAPLAGGKILAVGSTDDHTNAVRLNHDGSIDTSYGGGDGVSVDLPIFPDTSDYPSGITKALLLSNGKLLVMGRSTTDVSQLLVARLNADGSLDTSFGNSGFVTAQGVEVDFFQSPDRIGAALAPDGKIVVSMQSAVPAAASESGMRDVVQIFRFTAAGQLDTTFNTTGGVIVDPYAGTDVEINTNVTDVAVQSTGKIIFTGITNGATYLGRLNVDGSRDSSFTQGAVPGLIDPPVGALTHFKIPSTLLILDDDKILLGGTVGPNFENTTAAIARFNADGSSDSSFGTGGLASAGDSENFDITSMQLDSHGNIDALMVYSNSSINVARFSSAGTLDATFGDGGTFNLFDPETPAAFALDGDNTFLFAAANASIARAAPLPPAELLSDGTLLITGDTGDNTITLAPSGNNILLTRNGVQSTFSASAVKALEVALFDGNDTLTSSVSFSTGDFIDLGAGNNNVHLLNGPTTINAGAGADTVHAGNGDISIDLDDSTAADDILVGNGLHTLTGGPGNDTIVTGDGDSTVDGHEGDDSITTGAGNDSINCGLGNDTVSSGAGDDNIFGDSGDDSIDAGAGNDTVAADTYGGGDNRFNNTVYGGDGNDSLVGDDGHDTLYGGAGRDTLWGYGNSDLLVGGGGNDKIAGMGGNDRIHGGAGNDQLSGGGGNDRLYGQAGNDKLFAGNGINTLDGGDGNDYAQSYSDRDLLTDIEVIAPRPA